MILDMRDKTCEMKLAMRRDASETVVQRIDVEAKVMAKKSCTRTSAECSNTLGTTRLFVLSNLNAL